MQTAELNNLLTAMTRRTALVETMVTRKLELALQERLRRQTTKNAGKDVGRCKRSPRLQASATIGYTKDALWRTWISISTASSSNAFAFPAFGRTGMVRATCCRLTHTTVWRTALSANHNMAAHCSASRWQCLSS